jgi:hypothetical protein
LVVLVSLPEQKVAQVKNCITVTMKWIDKDYENNTQNILNQRNRAIAYVTGASSDTR